MKHSMHKGGTKLDVLYSLQFGIQYLIEDPLTILFLIVGFWKMVFDPFQGLQQFGCIPNATVYLCYATTAGIDSINWDICRRNLRWIGFCSFIKYTRGHLLPLLHVLMELQWLKTEAWRCTNIGVFASLIGGLIAVFSCYRPQLCKSSPCFWAPGNTLLWDLWGPIVAVTSSKDIVKGLCQP